MNESTPFFHLFKQDITTLEKPEKFTFPFCYAPHALSLSAAQELQDYLNSQEDFNHNFGLKTGQEGSPLGKMFGVLVVENHQGTLGYLAACSGKLAGTNIHKYLVPPLFDMLDPEGFFRKQEVTINALNREIEAMEELPDIPLLRQLLEETQQRVATALAEMRMLHKQNKSQRKVTRGEQKSVLSEEEYILLEQDLIKQSYRDQHDYDVLRQTSKDEVAKVDGQLQELVTQLSNKKEFRKQLSAGLQQQLFNQYSFLNAYGQRKSLLPIFEEAIQMLPPAGAGECAAPKLLQHAYANNLKPICMAEFWWGASPSSEIRKHNYFYPACKGKCEPILNHMLQGLSVDPNPLLENPADNKELTILFEDHDIIVINKPEEFLSVPGIHVQDSVQTRILQRNPEITGPLIIHRLDMSTSGILVLAKNKEAHQLIQDQFIRHTVKKRYTALLDGVITKKEGLIDFPLRVDLEDRPRQMLCYEYGKKAQTQFEVVAIEGKKTRIHYYPLTGRTHQLRVHSAHQQGLNTPIWGDDLYGQRADRLHLHAGYIQFVHPKTKESISFEVKDPF